MTFRYLLTNEILLLLVPLGFFLLVALIRAVSGKDIPITKVWLTIKAALFGVVFAVAVRPFQVPVQYTPYVLEIHGLVVMFCWANLAAYLLVDIYLYYRMKREVPSFLRELLLLAVYVFFGATALRVIFEINMGSILTATTVLTAALALAMQTSLANIVSGFQIQADKGFQRGTWVWIQDKDIRGEVVNIGFRYATLKTIEEHLVHVPNHFLTQNVVLTIGSRQVGPTGINHKVLLDYAFPPERAKAVLLRALQDEPAVLREPAPSVRVDLYMESGIQYNIRFYLEDYGGVLRARDGILRRVWYGVMREGYSFPYPHRAIVTKVPEPTFRMETGVIRENLRRVGILAPLGDEDLDALSRHAQLRIYGKGETVVRQGEEGDSLFINLCGNLDVFVDGQQVGALTGGDFFGEMSLLTGEKRRATVTAADEVWLVEISKGAIAPLIQSHPAIVEGLSATLGERLEKILTAHQVRKVVEDAPTLQAALLRKLRRFFGIS
jgi:small-conductance mechanosensitive channel/CRP-like cAMP-binding protein